ncbi:MAG TPA: aldehyde dehydrogenase family protein, partial [Gemmatimonadales bacterium]|nr:aldehyde dehydrogenase family protein [Gemmatimonadales bacterium]
MNPATGSVVTRYQAMTAARVDRALHLANRAYEAWRLVSIAERGALMRRAGEVLRRNAATYAEVMATEMGKP